MKVVYCEPFKNARVKNIGDGLNALQKAVGGYIEAIYPFDDPVAIVCNEEGKYNGMFPSRALYDDDGHMYDVIYGPFFICGLGEEDFADISDDLAEKYLKMFKRPLIDLIR